VYSTLLSIVIIKISILSITYHQYFCFILSLIVTCYSLSTCTLTRHVSFVGYITCSKCKIRMDILFSCLKNIFNQESKSKLGLIKDKHWIKIIQPPIRGDFNEPYVSKTSTLDQDYSTSDKGRFQRTLRFEDTVSVARIKYWHGLVLPRSYRTRFTHVYNVVGMV
jgi:hypothetical protein